MKKVLIPTKLNTVAKELLEADGKYEVIQDENADLMDLAAAHSDAYALIVRSDKVTQEVIDALPSLKVVVRAGSGYNTIDTKYARKRGVDVMNTPGANANAVAEEVVTLILADIRHVVAGDPSVRSGKWEKKNFMGRELTGKTVGIVGLGAIGRMLARRLTGFECKLLGYDPMISQERARDFKVELTELESVFQQSDFVTLHLPENDETRGMIGEKLLGLMKPGATLINCARAGILDEDAMRSLKDEKGLRFLNDVYPKDAEGDKSVADIADLMLPHLGASTVEANINAARRAAEELIEYDEKGVTSFVVNRDIPEGLDEAYCELAYTLSNLCRCVMGPKNQIKLIETSFYGDLKPYSQWLLVPIVAALSEEFDRSMDYQAAINYLKEQGVEYDDRETDDAKGYSNSITVDLTGSVDADTLRHASIRGTVAESNLMISRINDFDKLYFEPVGKTLFFCYKDRPGVLGQIGASLAEAGVNIDDVRNPHDSRGETSLAILKVSGDFSQSLVDQVAEKIQASFAFALNFSE